MSDADQHEPNQKSAAAARSAGPGEGQPVSKFEVVPTRETNVGDLYTYRENIAQPQAERTTQQRKGLPVPLTGILLVAGLLALVAFAIVAAPSLFQPKPPVPYIDMGSQRYDPAGLSGRLIARWEQQSGGSYQFFLDPIDPQQIASFAAVAQDPSRQLSVTLRFRDAAGLVACQKQILFPASVAHTPGTKFIAPREPQQTQTGDTVVNMTGQDGQIAEIDLTGPLPCGPKAYASFNSWDFFTNFPTVAEQDDWLRHEKAPHLKGNGRNAEQSAQIQRLPTGIEGDDVIVADNPSHGTIETSAGRVFFLGVTSMQNRTADWQVFPAPIHFRCDKNGSCVLTRPNSHVSMQARLMK
jgi:hypothetical protein